MGTDKEMLRLDPESERCVEQMTEIIAEEITVRVALGNSESTTENIKLWATLAADSLVRAFVVRPRAEDTPLFKWVEPDQ